MIDPKELRINNWYISTKFQVPVRCEISDFSQMEALAGGAQVDAEIVSRVFEPLPLDEQWLLRLGFKEEIDSHYVKFWDKDGHKIYHEYYIHSTTGREYFELSGYKTYVGDSQEIIYVHQLQNLYRALTNQELT